MVYCEAKRILMSYENKQGSLQSLIAKSLCTVILKIYKSTFKKYIFKGILYFKHKNSLTCLIMKTLSYQKLLNKIIKRSKLLERERFLGDKLAQLLVYDVLFGMGVRGKFKSSMKRNFTALSESMEHYIKKYNLTSKEELLKKFEISSRVNAKPKYIFINTLVHTKKEILQKIKEQNFIKIKPEATLDSPDNTNDNDLNKYFINVINNLKTNEFIKDEHVKNMYIFSADSLLNKSFNLFKEGHLLQIDKVINFTYFKP
jgi:25S rRNA (cytosine2278-C5)-methyltransferase